LSTPDATPSDLAAIPSYGTVPNPINPGGASGGLRLKVEPRESAVYVDGYYAGFVDDFNGYFDRLKLAPGEHHVEIRAAGYRTLQFEITIEAAHTITYRGKLLPSPQ
jgi:hypothetical protein